MLGKAGDGAGEDCGSCFSRSPFWVGWAAIWHIAGEHSSSLLHLCPIMSLSIHFPTKEMTFPMHLGYDVSNGTSILAKSRGQILSLKLFACLWRLHWKMHHHHFLVRWKCQSAHFICLSPQLAPLWGHLQQNLKFSCIIAPKASAQCVQELCIFRYLQDKLIFATYAYLFFSISLGSPCSTNM